MTTSLQELTMKFQQRVQSKPGFGSKAKILIEDVGCITLDGTHDTIKVTNDNSDTAVTLKMSLETLESMQKGELNGMEAFFQGLLVVEGDQAVAMSLGDVLDLE